MNLRHPTDHTWPLSIYGFAISLILKQLFWESTFSAIRSRHKLKSLWQKHNGQSAVILCNGPSLRNTDFSLLDNVTVIGLNKINLLVGHMGRNPDYLVAVNQLVIEQNADFFNKTNIPLFINRFGTKHIKHRPNICFLNPIGIDKFATDISRSIYEGATVTYVAMQLAYHLGFSRVALVGCDHNFAVHGPANKTVQTVGQDLSHFDPNYFKDGQKWQLPDLIESERSYLLAKKVYQASGRMLVNCTEGGKLEIFDRMSLGDFIRGV